VEQVLTLTLHGLRLHLLARLDITPEAVEVSLTLLRLLVLTAVEMVLLTHSLQHLAQLIQAQAVVVQQVEALQQVTAVQELLS